MQNRIRIPIVLLFCFILISCAGKPTPYQPSDGLGEGYRNFPLGGGAYRVEFWANMDTDPDTLKGYLMRRSGELCKENGYSDFKVINVQPQLDEHNRHINIQCVN